MTGSMSRREYQNKPKEKKGLKMKRKIYMSKNGPISWPEREQKINDLRDKILKELERREVLKEFT